MITVLTKSERSARVELLSRQRRKDWVLRVSGIVVLVGMIWAWSASQPLFGRLSSERRWSNFLTFSETLIPSPLRKSGEFSDVFSWGWELLVEGGFEALFATVGIAAAAILLAAAMVFPCIPLASRKFSTFRPFGLQGGKSSRLLPLLWKVVGSLIRCFFVLTRSIPEYLIAFLLISLLGLQFWPVVLALAIHNFGILGRLWGEVVENTDDAASVHRYASGNGRAGTYLTATVPGVLNRFLIYFFYRWETCVKDATVLGMLGFLTLGKLIALSKGFFWDEMLFYVLLGSAVILSMDFLSTWLRRRLR